MPQQDAAETVLANVCNQRAIAMALTKSAASWLSAAVEQSSREKSLGTVGDLRGAAAAEHKRTEQETVAVLCKQAVAVRKRTPGLGSSCRLAQLCSGLRSGLRNRCNREYAPASGKLAAEPAKVDAFDLLVAHATRLPSQSRASHSFNIQEFMDLDKQVLT